MNRNQLAAAFAGLLSLAATPTYAVDRTGHIDLEMAHLGGKCFTFNLIEYPADADTYGVKVDADHSSFIQLLIAKAEMNYWVTIRKAADIPLPRGETFAKTIECAAGDGHSIVTFPQAIDVWGVRPNPRK